MTLRRWTILSVILLVPGFVLQFLSRTVFVPEAGVIGGLLLAAGLAIQLFVIRCPEGGAHLPLFPANTANTAETGWTGINLSGADFRFGRIPWAFLTS